MKQFSIGFPGRMKRAARRADTHADLRRPTAFNTYTIPGAATDPDRESQPRGARGCGDPAPVDCLYFVTRYRLHTR